MLASFVGGRLAHRTRATPPTAWTGNPDDEALLALCRLCGDRSTIGARYLTVRSGAADREVVLAQLWTRLADLGGRRHPSELLTALRRRIREDFAVGEVVMVDGWLLARTEAELCALSVLANP